MHELAHLEIQMMFPSVSQIKTVTFKNEPNDVNEVNQINFKLKSRKNLHNYMKTRCK